MEIVAIFVANLAIRQKYSLSIWIIEAECIVPNSGLYSERILPDGEQ